MHVHVIYPEGIGTFSGFFGGVREAGLTGEWQAAKDLMLHGFAG